MSTEHPIFISDHPLIQHKMGLLRDENTKTKDFCQLVKEISMLLVYEATRDLRLEETMIRTPICETTVHMLAGKSPVLVPILRAGLGMCEGVRELMPQADVGHIGMYRDEASLEPVEYYKKLPADCAERQIFLLDPMLATGNSACDALRSLRELGCDNIVFVCLVAAQQGLDHLLREFPDVRVVAAAHDTLPLTENGYIQPGLGDAGDRIFGTK